MPASLPLTISEIKLVLSQQTPAAIDDLMVDMPAGAIRREDVLDRMRSDYLWRQRWKKGGFFLFACGYLYDEQTRRPLSVYAGVTLGATAVDKIGRMIGHAHDEADVRRRLPSALAGAADPQIHLVQAPASVDVAALQQRIAELEALVADQARQIAALTAALTR